MTPERAGCGVRRLMLAAGGHGIAHAKGHFELARILAVASLVGSLGVVLPATALPAT
ncbi:hypothetical protein [Streptomyces atratus]|uniref:hypothetical protein n=1 Tax=Streptomyces atratus TaxID=1893 RepID=UPI003645F766